MFLLKSEKICSVFKWSFEFHRSGGKILIEGRQSIFPIFIIISFRIFAKNEKGVVFSTFRFSKF